MPESSHAESAHGGPSRRTVLTAGLGLVAGTVLVGAGAGAGRADAAQVGPATTPLPYDRGAPWWARNPTPWWSGLTPQQQAGQRVVYSYSGLTPPQELLAAIGAGTVGGVIFFGENISDSAQLAAVCAQLRAAQAGSPVPQPILLMTDQEGGQIRRLPDADPQLSEKQIGEAANPDAAAAQAGTGAASALTGAGMNLDLAPVLDVFRSPGDFDDQWERSYSSDPAVAGRLGAEFVAALQAAGVAATAKHFPGLGAASADQNTDEAPVTLGQPLAELRSVDEAAFAPAIAAGTDLIMTSWAIYPAVDATYPAGLSPAIVQGELRGQLGYAGVTITDALEAGAVATFGDTGEVALLAAKAGMDLILCSRQDPQQGMDAVTALAAAIAAAPAPSTATPAPAASAPGTPAPAPAGNGFDVVEHTAALHRIQTLRSNLG
jgi:beta-N-acetylhexosaminidase